MTPDHYATNLVTFGRALRAGGIAVDPGQIVDFERAMALIAVTEPEQFYRAARTILVRRLEDLALFDRIYAVFWKNVSRPELIVAPQVPIPSEPGELPDRDLIAGEEAGDESDLPLSPGPTGTGEALSEAPTDPHDQLAPIKTYSPADLAGRDFNRLSATELEEARALLRRLRWHVGLRQTRRTRPARRGRSLALRSMIRAGLRTGDELTRLVWKQPKPRPRPVVLLGDISGSMDQYTRLLIEFLYAVRRGQRDVEVFVFGTRLTRITRDLEHRNVDEAMRRVGARVTDWSGGTRIGEALATFNRQWGRRVLGRSAVTIVVSDGWDRGDPAELQAELARLQRSSYRLIWLNPLLGQAGYSPRTAGMTAALPFIDDFLPANTIASLRDFAQRLAHLATRRPVRSHHGGTEDAEGRRVGG